MTTKTVLVRGPRGRAAILALVSVSERTCQVTDSEGLDMLTRGNRARVAVVHRRDVFTFVDGVRTGDCPNWTDCVPI